MSQENIFDFIPKDLSCPKCLSILAVRNEEVFCSSCRRSWPLKRGIALLQEQGVEDFPNGELPISLSHEMINSAYTLGWQKALEGVLEKLPPQTARYFQKYALNRYRSSFELLMDLDVSSRVLDFGCGWGEISCDLASQTREVVSMDLAFNRAFFTGLRAHQSGLKNVRVICGGDTLRLPFPDASFDGVIMNGVLEWLPAFFKGHPGQIQERMLKEVHRVLHPGGQLFLAIENRFWYRYFLGTPEVHTLQKWLPLLPRFFARIFSRLFWKKDFRIWTYSLGEYLKMFKRLGFSTVDAYQMMPEYNFPEEIIPLFHPSSRRNTQLDRVMRYSLIRKNRILAHQTSRWMDRLAYTYGFIVEK